MLDWKICDEYLQKRRKSLKAVAGGGRLSSARAIAIPYPRSDKHSMLKAQNQCEFWKWQKPYLPSSTIHTRTK